ncbi:MAG: endonuclease III domain-containing protein [Deltaproteobacteria bacterium]|nr:endonuclease III domain-containing protein [Deltaproteobacteria bacterium]
MGPEALLDVYERLNDHFGPLHWWPADGPFEVMVGTVLTQNTAWTNVEKAIAALKARGLLSPEAIAGCDEETLAGVIRPAGFYHIKARRLKSLVRFFQEEYGGEVARMAAENLTELRDALLSVSGVGEETADCILLYACEKPSFVSDAYTRRILGRHRLIAQEATYGQIRNLFMAHLPQEVALFNQYHALLVNLGKHFCRKTPRCGICPLQGLLPAAVPM